MNRQVKLSNFRFNMTKHGKMFTFAVELYDSNGLMATLLGFRSWGGRVYPPAFDLPFGKGRRNTVTLAEDLLPLLFKVLDETGEITLLTEEEAMKPCL